MEHLVHTTPPEACNVVEVHFIDPDHRTPSSIVKDTECIQTCVSEAYFKKCIEFVKPHNLKYFEKSFKSYVCGEVVLENHDHKDMKVYSKHILDIDKSSLSKGAIVLYCFKEKKPYHAFPSTTSIHSVFYTNRLVLRINHRIYINFDTEFYPEDNTTLYKVFLNYNHDTHVDMEHAFLSMQTILKSLLQG